MLDFLRIVGHHRARLATQIRTVQKSYGNADIDNIPFGEEMYNRVRGRPLLIDTSAKVSEGKSKPRSTSREERNVKTNTSMDIKSVSSDSASLSNTDKKEQKKMASEDGVMKNNSKNVHVTSMTPSLSAENDGPTTSTSKAVKGEPRGSEATERQGDGSVSFPNTKKESRPAMEDNIVLGVALEGSKRTLPIEGLDPHVSESEQDTVEIGSLPNDKKGQSHTP
jgi:MscS family membrane protein